MGDRESNPGPFARAASGLTSEPPVQSLIVHLVPQRRETERRELFVGSKTGCRPIHETGCWRVHSRRARRVHKSDCWHVHQTSCWRAHQTSCWRAHQTSCWRAHQTSCWRVHQTSCWRVHQTSASSWQISISFIRQPMNTYIFRFIYFNFYCMCIY